MILLSTPGVLALAVTGRIVTGVVGFSLGLAAFTLLAIIEYGAWALIVPARARGSRESSGTEGPNQGELENPGRPIVIEADDGAGLAGLWYSADQGGLTGRTVVLLHGFGEAPGIIWTALTAALNRGGWNVAAIDLRGYGRSGGLFASFGGREAADVRAWIDSMARQHKAADGFTPVLWGRSMGAAIALRAAAEDTRVRALVLESPMVDLDHALASWFRKRRLPLGSLLARLVTRRASKLAGVSLTRPRPLELAPRVRCPVLIIHGTDDSLVPTPLARRLCAAFYAPPRFVEVAGAGHADVVAVGAESVLGVAVEFLREVTA
jgi:alpha-beta hydrolase superfamily lysophospholipase